MDILSLLCGLLLISAIFSYINEKFLKLPRAIGVAAIAVLVSVLILMIGRANHFSRAVSALPQNINFSKVLLDVLLGFLLFASALNFDYGELKARRREVFFMSTFGVLVSASVYGVLLHFSLKLLDIQLPMVYSFLFGSIISPTDPIAVNSILKKSKVPTHLHTILSGESLFNDGVGLILFVVIFNIANRDQDLSATSLLMLFGREILGGMVIGASAGFLAYRLMRSVTEHQTLFLISLALVLGVSVMADRLHASIPLAAVTAGLLIGNKKLDNKNEGNLFMEKIWALLDEVLNTILFVMIGLQLAVMPFLTHYWLTGLICILVILLARAVSVLLPAAVLLRKIRLNSVVILSWAGLRGGISIAMALRLPTSAHSEFILANGYFIVIFSIMVQGLSLNALVSKVMRHKNLG